MKIDNKPHLVCGQAYGTNSGKIYREKAELYDWEKSGEAHFGKQGQPLYARNVTPEGYGVWCIAHSNLTGDKGGNWDNYIYDDTIEEFWKKLTFDYLHDFYDTTTRVVFAKKNGAYEFYGVYELVGEPNLEEREWFGKYGCVKVYRRISKDYPIISK